MAKLRLLISSLFICLVTVLIPMSGVAKAQLSQCDINDIIAGNSAYDSCGNETFCTSDALVGSDNIQKTLNFLLSHQLTLVQAAGVIGNLRQESGQNIDPSDEQVKGQSWTDTSNAGGHGVGIVQWDSDRRPKMINAAFSAGLTLQDLETNSEKNLAFQLQYMWTELTTDHQGTYSQLKGDNDVASATTDFEVGYEGAGTPNMSNRIQYAQDVLDNYSGGGVTTTSSSCASTCDSGTSTTDAGLSQVRQNVVCVSQQEFKIWQNGVDPATYCKKYINGLGQDGGNTGGSCEEWCADFVSWVYNQAGHPFTGGASGGWRYQGVIQIYNDALADGDNLNWHPPSSNYTPVPGDVVLYSSATNRYAHTAIVSNVVGQTLTTIGGDEGSGPWGGPDSTSVVSQDQQTSFYGSTANGEVLGYVSPE